MKKRMIVAIAASMMCMIPTLAAYGQEELEIYNEGKKYGFKDKTGNIVILARYSGVRDFREGYAAVNMGGKTKTVKQPRFNSSYKTTIGGKWGFIDGDGNMVAECIYDEVGSFTDKLAVVKSNKLYGYIDGTGNQVVAPKYTKAEDFSEGLAMVVSPEHKYGFVDTGGNEIIPCRYDFAYSFSEGLAAVNMGGRYEEPDDFIKHTFGIYDHVVFTGGKWGFVDTKGNQVIPLQYDNVDSFKNGKATVRLGPHRIEIDKPEQ
jgi:hypothetical protein